MRLPAALWLSDDYAFSDLVHNGRGDQQHITEMEESTRASATATALYSPLCRTNSHMPELTTSNRCRVHSTDSAIGRLYRVWWFLSIGGLLSGAAAAASSVLWGINTRSFPYVSLSHLLENAMYFVLSTAAVLITCTYILLGRTHSTLIPCIHETWYKMLTVLLIAMALAAIIVAVLETRQLHDGTISTLPEFQCDQTSGLCVPVARGHGNINT
jgi:magnesium-transporting ATPase (P-type)